MIVSSPDYLLSERGAANFRDSDHWRPIEEALNDPFDKEKNPKGTIIMGLAENTLMHKEISAELEKRFSVTPATHLTYGTGPRGSLRLRTAISSYLTSHFQSLYPVTADQIVVLSGVGAVTDALAWSILNEGEGILIPRPLYTGFNEDLFVRSRGVVVPVDYMDLEGYRDLHSTFEADLNKIAFEKALKRAEDRGITVKGVILANPNNPLGRCYPVETIKAIARFCGQHNLHLISDEIYANSVFENKSNPDATKFTSILSLKIDDLIDPKLVHVMYGASKDFCSNGARVGVIQSRSKGVLGAVESLSVFAWPPYMIQDAWASLLEDEAFLNGFFAENQRRLAENYALGTSLLDKYKISYLRGGNAGIFLWIDLRPWLLPGLSEEDLKKPVIELRYDSPHADQYRQREKEVLTACKELGVFIAYGTNFFTEELGWFRISFTAGKEPMIEGISRIAKALEKIKGKGWKRVEN